MAATTNIEESSSRQMKSKTWVLKVSIHCNGCKKKVIKLLSSVEGVHKLEVDLKQQSVIVTGNVESDTLINKLIKSGRNAELWCQLSNQNNSGKHKNTDQVQAQIQFPTTQCQNVAGGDDKDKEKSVIAKSDATQVYVNVIKSVTENPATASEGGAGGGDLGSATKANQSGDTTTTDSGGEVKAVKEVGNKSEVELGSETTAATATAKNNHGEDEEGKVSKKKKNKGQNGNCSSSNNLREQKQERQVESPVDVGPPKNIVAPVRANNIPPRHQMKNQYVPPVYVVNYNMASTAPSYTTSYYAASPTRNQYNYREPERMAPPSDLEGYSRQPLDSFEMFSDENPNGCSIM